MSLPGDIVSAIAAQGTVRIETALTPFPFDIPLIPNGQAGMTPPAWLSLVKPKVTIFESGIPVLTVAPAGDPADGLPWGLILIGGLAVFLLFLRR